MGDDQKRQRLARERLLHRYDDALARGDMATVADILARAEEDPELAQMLIALNAAMADFGWSDEAAPARRDARATTQSPVPAQRLPVPDAPTWPRGWLSGALSVALVLVLLVGALFVILQLGGTSVDPVAAPPATAASVAPTGPSLSGTQTARATSTPLPTTAPVTPPTAQSGVVPSPTLPLSPAEPLTLTPPGPVNVFPGPHHYQGDRLTVAIALEEYVAAGQAPVTVGISGVGSVEVTGRYEGNTLLVPLDTTDLSGEHFLTFEADIEGVQVNQRFYLELLPASQRPAQEEAARWESVTLPCCTIHYISHTAAARDIDLIVEQIERAAAEFTALTGIPIESTADIYMVDRVWGTGGFAGTDEIIVSYTDRDYAPGNNLERVPVVARNGFSYVTELNPPFFRYRLGLAAYLAGGHYQLESIPRRAAAAGANLFNSNQVEMLVLREAAAIAYMVERFGWETVRAYVAADSGQAETSPEQTDAAMRQVFGIGAEEFAADLKAWLAEMEVTSQEQAEVRLSMRLHTLRRQYQTYVPNPYFLLGPAGETYGRNEAVPTLIREPRRPVNVAMELMLANARRAIDEGRTAEAEALLRALDGSLRQQALILPLAAEYAAIARLLHEAGYETVELALDGNRAIARVTRTAPAMEELQLQKVNGSWRISIP